MVVMYNVGYILHLTYVHHNYKNKTLFTVYKTMDIAPPHLSLQVIFIEDTKAWQSY